MGIAPETVARATSCDHHGPSTGFNSSCSRPRPSWWWTSLRLDTSTTRLSSVSGALGMQKHSLGASNSLRAQL